MDVDGGLHGHLLDWTEGHGLDWANSHGHIHGLDGLNWAGCHRNNGLGGHWHNSNGDLGQGSDWSVDRHDVSFNGERLLGSVDGRCVDRKGEG